MQALLFVSLAVAALAVVFALQNNSPISLNFFTWSFPSTLAVVILISVVTGAFASFLAALPGLVKLKWQLRSARHQIAGLEAAAARAAAPGPAAGREKVGGRETGFGP